MLFKISAFLFTGAMIYFLIGLISGHKKTIETFEKMINK